MKQNKILVLDFEPLYEVFERTKTMQTQKIVIGLRVRMSIVTARMLGLAIVTVRTLIWALKRQDKFKNFH